MNRIISVIVCIALNLAAAVSFAETYTIGITQFAEHGSLDNCREGFLAGLKEAGIDDSRLEEMAENMIRRRKEASNRKWPGGERKRQ